GRRRECGPAGPTFAERWPSPRPRSRRARRENGNSGLRRASSSALPTAPAGCAERARRRERQPEASRSVGYPRSSETRVVLAVVIRVDVVSVRRRFDMRKLIAGMKISLDGKMEGPEGMAVWVEIWSVHYGLSTVIDTSTLA